MAFSTIAQQTISRKREDGTTRQFQFTFMQDGASAQNYNIPIVGEVNIKHGDRSDAPNKSFKVTEAEFNMKGANEPLIDAIIDASLREIYLKIEDTNAGKTYFEGFVLPDKQQSNLYEKYQAIPVKCYGAIADLKGDDVPLSGNEKTIDSYIEESLTSIDLTRELDLYTSLHHNNQSSSDPLPNLLRFDPSKAVGEVEGKTRLDALKSVFTSLGWQMFQVDGRMVVADLFDRYNNSQSINKHEGDGAGGYNNLTEDILINLDESNVLRGGNVQKLESVIRHNQNYQMTLRDSISFTDPTPQSLTEGQSQTYELDEGLFLEGDIIHFQISGQLNTNGEPTATTNGTLRYGEFKLISLTNGSVFWYDKPNDEWVTSQYEFESSFSFTVDGGQQASVFGFGLDLPPVPEGVGACKIEAIIKVDITFSSGDSSQIDDADFDELDTFAQKLNDPNKTITHQYYSASNISIGATVNGSFFIGDKDQYSDQSTFEYATAASPTSWIKTEQWISSTGNGTIGRVSADRVGIITVGDGIEFSVQIRDTTFISPLNVFKIDDNNGNPRTCFPVEIQHKLFKGYYTIRLREVFDGIDNTGDLYLFGSADAGTSTSGSGGTSGVTNWGEIVGTLSDQTDLQSALNDKTDLTTFNSHANNTNNPHSVDKSDVGLGNVRNFDIAPDGDTQPVGQGDNVQFGGAELANYLRIPTGVDKF